jgi:prolyl oligopeptidase
MPTNRRQLLASSAALALASTAPRAAFAAGPPAPPIASVRPVTETLHGMTITDRYRWMETPSDPEWMPYLMGQNAYARAVLASIPGRDTLAEKISAVTGDATRVTRIQQAGRYLFTKVQRPGGDTLKLCVREGPHGQDRLLIDPDALATAGTPYTLDYWEPSPDGERVAYGMSAGGSGDSVLRFIETATGKVLPEALDRAELGNVAWTADGAGVFIPRVKEGATGADRYSDIVCWFHKVGTDPATDVKVMGKGLDPDVTLQDSGFPIVQTFAHGDAVLGTVVNGVQNEIELYLSSTPAILASKPQWRRVCGLADAVTAGCIVGTDIYLLTHKGAPRYRVVKTTLASPNFADAVEAMPEGAGVAQTISGARDGLYVQTLEGAVGGLYRLTRDGRKTQVKTPFTGSISFVSTANLADGCWFKMQGWVRPPVVCYAAPDGAVTLSDIAPKPAIDVSRYDSAEVWVKARDGVMVPLSILYAKDCKRDGTAPVQLYAYGAYGNDQNPAFIADALPWLDLGGVSAVAHVRGGGELGEAWHLAGKGPTKPNTWRDAIDCAEYLIAERWTDRGKIAVEGGSAGGIMVGRFLTERPDLLAIAISQVGVSNAIRTETEPNGAANVPEFGSVADADGFRDRLEMDAYQHVRDGTAYPAVLLTTGLNDSSVAPWEAGKMAARLQAATSSKRPVLLRVETNGGHNNSTRKHGVEETADVYAFILWQTGDPRFQPKS